jgi:hypothetical protein
MTTRLLKSKVSEVTNANIRLTAPWVTSGFMIADTVVKAGPGILGGVLVTATDADGDINVIVYDSASAASGVELCRVTIPTTTSLTQASFGNLAGPGVECENGIYVDVVAGDCQVTVYYK